MMCLRDRTDIRTKRNLMNIRKTKNLQSCLEFARGHIITKLADISRCNDRNDLIAVTKRMRKLEDLRFIRDRTERTAYHTHTTGNTLVIQDARTPLLITSDRLDTTCLLARAHVVGDRIIRTGCFTFSAFYTFFLIDKRLSVLHRDRALRTDLHTWMGNTSAAHVADNVFVRRTGCTCRRDHLHKRRLIIFLIDIAGSKTVGQMDRLAFRAKRKPHGETDSFACNGPFSVNTLTVLGSFTDDIVRDGFNIMDQAFVRRFKSGLCHFSINLVSDLSDWGIIISHIYFISLNKKNIHLPLPII